MQSLQPSDHTKLLNLSIFLGKQTNIIRPVLYERGYPLQEISLRIPIPGYKPGNNNAATPDCGYSSKGRNAVIFLESKGGGCDREQLNRFEYVRDNPSSLLRTRNNFQVSEEDLIIDFALLCSNIDRIRAEHVQSPINCPILHYDASNKLLVYDDCNKAAFMNEEIREAFSEPIPVPKLPILYIPFGPTDYNGNFAYVAKNIFLTLLAYSQTRQKYERMPPILDLVKRQYPLLNMMGREELGEMGRLIENMLKRLFPDADEVSRYNLAKYISIKKGKLYVKNMTLPKFLEVMEAALLDLEKRKLTRQSTLAEFSQSSLQMVDIDIDFDKFFGKF